MENFADAGKKEANMHHRYEKITSDILNEK